MDMVFVNFSVQNFVRQTAIEFLKNYVRVLIRILEEVCFCWRKFLKNSGAIFFVWKITTWSIFWEKQMAAEILQNF